jgi:hypothetical protein
MPRSQHPQVGFRDPNDIYMRVSAGGGVATPVTTVAVGDSTAGHRFPAFLPDGVLFLYDTSSDKPDTTGAYFGSLEGTPPVRLLPDNSNALCVAPANMFLVIVDAICDSSTLSFWTIRGGDNRHGELGIRFPLPPDENRPPNHGGTWNTSLRYWRLRGACRRYSSRVPEVGVSPTATLQARAAPNCALLLSGAAKPPRSASFPSKVGAVDRSLKRFVSGAFIVQAIVGYLLLHYGS